MHLETTEIDLCYEAVWYNIELEHARKKNASLGGENIHDYVFEGTSHPRVTNDKLPRIYCWHLLVLQVQSLLSLGYE